MSGCGLGGAHGDSPRTVGALTVVTAQADSAMIMNRIDMAFIVIPFRKVAEATG